MEVGYAVHPEQYSPRQVVENIVRAEDGGFDSIWTADHFHPWIDSNAQCGFAWVCIASGAERTRRVRIGTAVTCPILRYNPAIVAQAFATLGSLYAGRIFLGIGLGEPLNEMPLGYDWPSFNERLERLDEAIRVMNALWTARRVTFKGKYFSLRKATLYTRPDEKVPLYVAGNGSRTAQVAGKYADGFITSGVLPPNHYTDVLFPALEKGARMAGRNQNTIKKAVETYVSYAESFDKALASARFWAPTMLPAIWFKYPIYDPREIEACGDQVGNEQLAKKCCISAEPEDHVRNLERLFRLGFDQVYISSFSPDEKETIDFYSRKVLPSLKG